MITSLWASGAAGALSLAYLTLVARPVRVAGSSPALPVPWGSAKSGRVHRWRGWLVPVGVGATCVGIDSWVPLRVWMLAAGGIVVAWWVGRLWAGRRELQCAGRRRQQVVEFCEALLGELQAGLPLEECLRRSAAMRPEFAAVGRATELAGDVPTELRAMGRVRGAGDLVRLAAAWEVCSATGAALSDAVARVLASARADAALSRRLEEELAAARATARLIAGLPVLVLIGAQGLGSDPWAFLFTSTAGAICLVGGATLTVAGLQWIDWLGTRALEEPR